MKSNIVAYSFGNNEWTPPNGVDLRDRRTGALIWRRTFESSIMTSPVINDNILYAIESNNTAHAFDVSTGHEKWRITLPKYGASSMANPVLSTGNLVQTFEPTRWCAIAVPRGLIKYCKAYTFGGMGGGTSSAALTDSLFILTGAIKRWQGWKSHLHGLRTNEHLESRRQSVSVIAADITNGSIRWKTKLTGKMNRVFGHTAGTPVIAANVAVVALPTIGEVVAIQLSDGKILWRSTVNPRRGSITVYEDKLFVAALPKSYTVLSIRDGRTMCKSELPSEVDRTGLSLSGSTGVMTFLNGMISAAPISQWLTCNMRWTAQNNTFTNPNNIAD